MCVIPYKPLALYSSDSVVLLSSGNVKRPPIFILYALELDTFQKVSDEDYPAYSLVLDLANMLHALNLPCLHDGSE